MSSVGVLFVLLAAQAPAQNQGFKKKPMDQGQMGGQFGARGQGQQDNLIKQETAFLQGLLQQLQNGAVTSEQLQTQLQQRITGLQSMQQQQNRGGQFGGQQKGAMKMRGK